MLTKKLYKILNKDEIENKINCWSYDVTVNYADISFNQRFLYI